MKTRFEGSEGQRYLVEALKTQSLVQHDSDLATFLSQHGQLREFGTGNTVIEQGASDNHIFFILAGDANVYIHGNHVVTRGPGEVVGELALIDAAGPRSATVKAKNHLTVLQIDEPSFTQVANKFPHVWRALSLLVGKKLRERADSIKAANPLPIMFVGSSVEGLPIAQCIQAALKHDPIDVRLWTDGVFGASSVTIDALLEQAEAADFAIFVFGPDDKIASRSKKYAVPRDNVILELGIFLGRLARSRTYFVMQHSADIKIPTDLLGITPLTYVHRVGARWESVVAPVCTELRERFKILGVK